MHCGACGNELPADARFCAVCGHAVGEAIGAAASSPAAAFAGATPVPGEPWKRGGAPPWAPAAPMASPGPAAAAAPAPAPMMQPVPPTAPGQGYGYGYGYGYGASGPVQVKKRGVLGWLVRAVVALFAVVLLIGVAGGFYAVYQVMFGDNPPPALDGYMHGHGVAYHVPHGVLTVRLPDTPELQPDNVALGDRTLNGQISDVKRDTYEVGVGMVDAPATGTAALHGAMAGIGTRFNMNAASTKDITIAGQPAVEGHGTFQGDQVAVAVSIVKGKLYLLIVHTKTGAVDVLHEFEASARLDSRK